MDMVICGSPEKVWFFFYENVNFHQDFFFLRGHVGGTATFQPAATHAKFRSLPWPIESKKEQRQFSCFFLASQTAGAAAQWDAVAFRETFKIAWPLNEHRMKKYERGTVQRSNHTSRANNSHTPIQDVVGCMHRERHADGHWSGDLLIADWDDLEKSIASDRSPRQKNRVPGRPSHQVTCDGSLKQEEHVVPRPLRHRQVRKEGYEAGGDSDAQIQPPPSNEAGGDSIQTTPCQGNLNQSNVK